VLLVTTNFELKYRNTIKARIFTPRAILRSYKPQEIFRVQDTAMAHCQAFHQHTLDKHTSINTVDPFRLIL